MDNKAVVFPGQGSQFIGMGEDIYNTFPVAKNIFEQASDTLKENIPNLCFQENEKLNLTEFTQPAILTCEIAILEAIKSEFSISFSLFGGHSLGEYTALVASGTIEFCDALKIVKHRGKLMQNAVPAGQGAMIALIMEELNNSNYEEIVKTSKIDIANYNSSNQVVLSGEKNEIIKVGQLLTKKYPDLTIIELNVSAPFHSSLMLEMQKNFQGFLSDYKDNFKTDNAINVLSNYTGKFHEKDSLFSNLVNQISGSVRWVDNMKNLINKTSDIYEVGPAKPLSRFFKTEGLKITPITNLRSLKKAF